MSMEERRAAADAELKHHAKSRERSPVFLQFLDAVWQLQHMYPLAFEFNARFLLFLACAPYACQAHLDLSRLAISLARMVRGTRPLSGPPYYLVPLRDLPWRQRALSLPAHDPGAHQLHF